MATRPQQGRPQQAVGKNVASGIKNVAHILAYIGQTQWQGSVIKNVAHILTYLGQLQWHGPQPAG